MQKQFKNDIFISYGQLDNLPAMEGDPGWISSFHQALFAFVAQYVGYKPTVWRDAKLQGNDSFGDEIVEMLRQAAVLVAILSPRYVESEWCQKEIQTFCDMASQETPLHPVNKRLFKVLKYPLSQEQQEPEMLQKQLGYQFYEIDQAKQKAKEIRPEFGKEMEAEYLQRVADLAIDITDQLKVLQAGNEDSSLIGAEEPDRRQTVYLAETTGDLQVQRDRIKRELEQMNYRVLPDHPLPIDSSLRRDVTQYLEQSSLSIHLVGARYGVVPEGEDHSSIVLQHELALDRVQQDTHFTCVVWLSPEGQKLNPRIEQFRQELRNDAELLQLGIEDLKSHIQEKLKQPKSSPQPAPTDLIRIYLICDRNDRDDIAPIEDFLFDQGYEVLTPMFGEDAQDVRRQEHEEYLKICDAVLIYYGAGDERWQREQLQYLRKVAGFTQRTHPLWAKAILMRDPATQPKQRLRTREAMVLKNFGAFDPKVLAPFLEAIAQGHRGAAV